MGPELRTDFSSVRVHTDDQAAASARSVGAAAYTVGRHIVFDRGRYDPGDPIGRRLLRHELAHTIQQDGMAPSPAGKLEIGAPDDRLEAEATAAGAGHPPRSRARGPLVQRQPAPGAAASTPAKVPEGGIAATEIIPFPSGSRVLVTDMLRELIRQQSGLIKMANAIGKVPPDAMKVLEILLDPKTPISLEANIIESTPTTVRASVAVPAMPEHDLTARTIDVSLEATGTASQFDLQIAWGTGRQVFDVKARRSDGKIVISTTVQNIQADISLEKTPTGGLVASGAVPPEAQSLAGVKSLKLVSIEPLTKEAGTAEAATERAKTEQAAASSSTALPRQELSVGGGASIGAGSSIGRPAPALSMGWRFNFRAAGDALVVPLGVTLDYLPRSQMLTAGVGSGVEGRFPLKGVPVALSLTGGVRAGAAGVGGDRPAAVLGPDVGLRASVSLGPKVSVYLRGDYFQNLMSAARDDKGVGAVGTIDLGAAVRF
jgi:hypothetical protein